MEAEVKLEAGKDCGVWGGKKGKGGAGSQTLEMSCPYETPHRAQQKRANRNILKNRERKTYIFKNSIELPHCQAHVF